MPEYEKIKIITIVNNAEIFRAGLLVSDAKVLASVDIVKIDNFDNHYCSFAKALETVLVDCTDDELIVISHQDVVFYDNNSFARILEQAGTTTKDGYLLAGVVGRVKAAGHHEGKGVNSIISGGKELCFCRIDSPKPVDVIDECVIITNIRTIRDLHLFDDERFRWHLYAADASLRFQKAGYQPMVLPLKINHLSSGNLDVEYFDLAKLLLKKYNRKEIYTTCGLVNKRIVRLRKMKRLFSLVSIKKWLKFGGR